jgi:hypothetical protein
MPLAPPPELSYPDFEIAEEAIKSWARNEGYGVIRGRSKKDKRKDGATRRKTWILCDKSMESRAESGARRTASRKSDCPFKLTVTRSNIDSLWHVVVENSEHSPSTTTSSTFQSIRHSLTSIQSHLLLKHLPKHLPPKYPRSRHIYIGKGWAIWQALSLLLQALLQALLAVGHEADRVVGHVGGQERVTVANLTSTTAG